MVVVIASPTQNPPSSARGSGGGGTTSSTHLSRDLTASGRESRHVYVSGLPDSVSDERINSFFSSYGRVHQIERTQDGVVVSFMDVRSAQKAHAGDHRLDSAIPFRIAFHEPGGVKKYYLYSDLFERAF
ncbi:hypothetical protein Q1695_011196 [Nippostrongylus brasiliensis]|nr:hypothetical protein Q1695_011196 [Nippostrongylus brasiliensis]